MKADEFWSGEANINSEQAQLAFCVSLDELVDGFSLEAITKSSSGDRIINLVVICI
jgi:hypothetical protein